MNENLWFIINILLFKLRNCYLLINYLWSTDNMLKNSKTTSCNISFFNVFEFRLLFSYIKPLLIKILIFFFFIIFFKKYPFTYPCFFKSITFISRIQLFTDICKRLNVSVYNDNHIMTNNFFEKEKKKDRTKKISSF